ncbi:hypothetical protein [Methylorubrum extorquens]|uniref:hypothetical protein n=1 Tax=Methylorubrum extorquens TaxID=408 RepID=UPI0012DB14C2|nr:hypothetical protein [Methylorubrum extorquens]
MFGPQHLHYVIKFLEGVDFKLSEPMRRKHPPDEPALTNELCALLDAETQRGENRLSYNLDHLNNDLAAVGDGLDFEVTLDTHPHNTAMERHVSQSDFGLILEYVNFVLPTENWCAAYLVQAKRLFKNPANSEYDQLASFRAADAEQQARIDRLAVILGAGALKYGLYCPQAAHIPDITRTQVRALHTRNLSSEIFDFGSGLALRDFIATNGGIDAGIWLQSSEGKPTNLISLHDEAFRSALPFTWFIIEHFTRRSRDRSSVMRPTRGGIMHGDQRNEFLRRIVTGDNEAVRDLINQLSEAGEESKAPKNITVLPRHTITIKVTVGKSLPRDTARAQVD